ncbi:MAG: hypothetical protein ACYC6L_09775 [Anaerolineae bacterium]
MLRSGATPAEKKMALPGDGLLERTLWQATSAVSIRPPRRAVWPWPVQMGGGRAGWYWWVPLSTNPQYAQETVSPRVVLQQFQKLAVGDSLSDGGPLATRERGNWVVRELVPERQLVLYAARAVAGGSDFMDGRRPERGAWFICSWAFVLLDQGRDTRLLVRVRADGGSRLLLGLMKLTFGHGDTVAHSTMLQAIKERAKALAAAGNAPLPAAQLD